MSAEEKGPFGFGLLPRHTPLDVERVQLNLACSSRMLRHESVEASAVDLGFFGSQIQDAEIIAARFLGRGHNSGQSIREILEQAVLEIHGHTQNPVEEL